ncbi:MAG TPA: M1 family aminopeptidase [Candidatus Deferrimicrobiaceae bacterium]|nr:M1 family aminopeptidase [Candidatus Deferrimicrobiaceae bacterium]
MAKSPNTVRAGVGLLLLLLTAARAFGQPAVVHHDLAIRLYPEYHTFLAKDTVTVRHEGERNLVFTLSGNAAMEKVVAQEKDLAFIFEGEHLHVALPAGLSGKGDISLTISYRASFRTLVPEDPVNTEDPSYGVRGVILERGTFLSDAAGWYPEIPGSRPTFRLWVEGPAGYEAVTAGRLVRRETAGEVTRSEWETREPIGGLSLSAGPYLVREAGSGETRLFTYFHPETDALSEKYLAAVARYLDLYRGLFGPYPFEKFAVVENFFPTGYGFPSYTLLGSTVVRLPFLLGTSLGHEVAHSWWGNGVRVDYRKGNWSEGLATYVADYLYKERSSAEEGREYRLQILRDYGTLVPSGGDFPLSSFTGRDSPASRAIGYGKGAMVFHMARRRAGDEAFWKGLAEVAREKMFREASWDDFARAFGKNSGADFARFFRQWVDRPGAPVIALQGVRANRAGKGWRVSGRITQEKPYYNLSVPLHLIASDGKTDTVIKVPGKETSFAMASASRPLRLIVDPEVDLFRRLDATEIPPSVNGIRGSADLLVVAARGLPADIRKASKVLLAAMGKEKIGILREEDTPPSRLAGHDVLYLGLPGGKKYLPALLRELSVSPNGFSIGGTEYGSREDSLFVVLPHPSDKKRVAALFLSRSPEAAAMAARKIPHYGKYSYLVFSGGTNRAKGMWEVTASPTVHEFPPQIPAK